MSPSYIDRSGCPKTIEAYKNQIEKKITKAIQLFRIRLLKRKKNSFEQNNTY